MMKLLIFIISFFLISCATTDAFKNTPDAKLCIDYMTFPSINIWQGARADEIARRNLDCSQYTGVAEKKRQSNKDLEDALRDLRDNK